MVCSIMMMSKMKMLMLMISLMAVVAVSKRPPAKEMARQKMGQGLDESKHALSAFYDEQKSSSPGLGRKKRLALQDCQQMLELSEDALTRCYSELSASDTQTNNTWSWRDASYYRTWASAVQTNAETCLQSLAEANEDSQNYKFTKLLARTSELTSESLAYMKNISVVGTPGRGRGRGKKPSRRLMSEFADVDEEGFPSWLSKADRKLLQDTGVAAENIITVAQDGNGNFTTIGEAISAAPNKSSERTIIYVMGGIYFENVEVPKAKTNIMLIGDGIDVTVITGNRSVVDGWTTFNSATVAAVGSGFLARDMTFENTAGSAKHQAVALRVGSDLSAFYRCSFRGYQDTLYTHSLRQFYRECDVYGTVDFIFGNAAVVLQACNLYARKPMSGQSNVFTAQGRTDPNQNTGTSIHNCTVTADDDLAATNGSFKNYLGRPWKEYSRTVFMQSFLDSLIHPAGWLEWSGSFALDTLYYGEYNNSGPGSSTKNRVTWSGYHIMNTTDAQNFTVQNFIVGDAWLPDADVPYDSAFL